MFQPQPRQVQPAPGGMAGGNMAPAPAAPTTAQLAPAAFGGGAPAPGPGGGMPAFAMARRQLGQLGQTQMPPMRAQLQQTGQGIQNMAAAPAPAPAPMPAPSLAAPAAAPGTVTAQDPRRAAALSLNGL